MSERLPRSFGAAVGRRAEVTIRHALPADDAALARLAGLTDRRLPCGALLVAEADGVVLAVAGADGRTLADPFSVTTDVVELLGLCVAQLQALAA